MATLVAVVAGALVLVVLDARSPARPSSQAVSFQLPSLFPGGPPVSSASLGGRPAVVTFFASWCPPCRDELPALARFAASHRGVAFVGVDVADDPTAGRALVRQAGVDFPVGSDPDYSVAAGVFHVRGLPSSALLSPKGVVVRQLAGPVSPDTLAGWLAPAGPSVHPTEGGPTKGGPTKGG
jgi:thiol-disulfide isomerase/thioredoxin